MALNESTLGADIKPGEDLPVTTGALLKAPEPEKQDAHDNPVSGFAAGLARTTVGTGIERLISDFSGNYDPNYNVFDAQKDEFESGRLNPAEFKGVHSEASFVERRRLLERRRGYDRVAEMNPISSGAGMIAGTAPEMLLPAGTVVRGARLAGAAEGAVSVGKTALLAGAANAATAAGSEMVRVGMDARADEKIDTASIGIAGVLGFGIGGIAAARMSRVERRALDLAENELFAKGDAGPAAPKSAIADPSTLDLGDGLPTGRISEPFDPAKAGEITVQSRDGKLVVVDGRERVASAVQSGAKEVKIKVIDGGLDPAAARIDENVRSGRMSIGEAVREARVADIVPTGPDAPSRVAYDISRLPEGEHINLRAAGLDDEAQSIVGRASQGKSAQEVSELVEDVVASGAKRADEVSALVEASNMAKAQGRRVNEADILMARKVAETVDRMGDAPALRLLTDATTADGRIGSRGRALAQMYMEKTSGLEELLARNADPSEISKAIDDFLPNKPLPEPLNPASVGAAATMTETAEDIASLRDVIKVSAGGTGWADAIATFGSQFTPALRTLKSPIAEVRRLSVELFDRGFNVDGAARASLEATQRVRIARTMLQTMQDASAIYQDMISKGIVMSEEEFRKLTSNAIRQGEKSANPFVQRAAALWNSKVYNPMLRDMVERGLITEGTQIGSEGYLNRIHLPDEIKARPEEFKKIIREDTQQRLRSEYAKDNDDLNRALELLEQQAKDEGLALPELGVNSRILRGEINDLRQANQPYIEARKQISKVNDEIAALKEEMASSNPADRGVLRAMISEQEKLKEGIIRDAEAANGVIVQPNGRRSYSSDEALTYEDFRRRQTDLKRRLDSIEEQTAAQRELRSLREEADDIAVSADPVTRQQRIDDLTAKLEGIKGQYAAQPQLVEAADELKNLWTKWRDAKQLGDQTAQDMYLDAIRGVNRSPQGQALAAFNEERRGLADRLNRLSKDDYALTQRREEISQVYEEKASRLAARHASLSDRYASLLSKMENYSAKDALQQEKAVGAIQGEMRKLLRDIDEIAKARSKLDASFVQKMQAQLDGRVEDFASKVNATEGKLSADERAIQEARAQRENDYSLQRGERQRKLDKFLAEEYVEKPGTPEQQAKRLDAWNKRREEKIASFEKGEEERLLAFETKEGTLRASEDARLRRAETNAQKSVANGAGQTLDRAENVNAAGLSVAEINQALTDVERFGKEVLDLEDQIRKAEIRARGRKNGPNDNDKARIDRLKEKVVEAQQAQEGAQRVADGMPEPDFAGSRQVERYNSRAQRQLASMRENLIDAQRNLEIDISSVQQPSATTIAKIKDLKARADLLRTDSFDILENGFRKQFAIEKRLAALEDDIARATARRQDIGNVIQSAEKRVADERALRLDDIEARRTRLEQAHENKWGEIAKEGDDFYAHAEDIAEGVRIKLTGEGLDAMHRSGNVSVPVKRGPWKERTLIIDDMKLSDAGFLENDINILAERYLRSSIGDIEMFDRFGDTRMSSVFEKVQEQYAKIRQAVQLAQSDAEIERLIGVKQGRLGEAWDMVKAKAGIEAKSNREKALAYLTKREQQDVRDLTWARDKIRGDGETGSDLARAALNYTYTTRGGAFAFSNLADIGRIYMELGIRDGMKESMEFFAGLRRNPKYKFIGQMNQWDRDLANEVGIATEGVMHSALMQESGYQTVMNRGLFGTMEKMGNYANKLNGMQYLQAFSETVAAKVMLKRFEQALVGKDPWILEQLKIPEHDIARYRYYLDNFGTRRPDGKLSGFGFNNWQGGDAARLANELSAKMNEQVLSVVTRRGMGDIPIWAQGGSPWLGDFGRIIAQFGGYSMASFQKAAIRNAQNMSLAGMATYMGAMTSLGMMTTYLKLTVFEAGKDPSESRKSTNPGWWLSEGIKASPLLAMPLYWGSRVSDLSGIDPFLDPLKFAGRKAAGLDGEKNAAGGEIKDFKPSLVGGLGPVFGVLDRVRSGIAEPLDRLGKRANGEQVDQYIKPRDAGNVLSAVPFMNYQGARQTVEHMVKPFFEEE